LRSETAQSERSAWTQCRSWKPRIDRASLVAIPPRAGETNTSIEALSEPPSFVLHTGALTHLRSVLGLSRLSFHAVNHPIAITDVRLADAM
jgi:hypothetical protein